MSLRQSLTARKDSYVAPGRGRGTSGWARGVGMGKSGTLAAIFGALVRAVVAWATPCLHTYIVGDPYPIAQREFASGGDTGE